MKKILVPIDFSEISINALDAAASLARKFDCEIKLLNVIEEPGAASYSSTGETVYQSMGGEGDLFMRMLIKKTVGDMLSLVEEPKYKGVRISREVKVGNAFHTIEDMINETQSDLVVMGTSGASGMKELLVGSLTEKVVRYAKCPVLAIHQDIGEIDFKKIVIASQAEKADDKCLLLVRDFQKAFDAEVNVVKVITPNSFLRERTAKKQVESYIERCGIPNGKVHVYNEITEEEGIIYFADDVDADLIIMGTHGRTGLAQLFGGSLAEDIVNHAKRPVLTFKL